LVAAVFSDVGAAVGGTVSDCPSGTNSSATAESEKEPLFFEELTLASAFIMSANDIFGVDELVGVHFAAVAFIVLLLIPNLDEV
jgi:hypothetical protein